MQTSLLGSSINTYIRTGSGDRLATDMEAMAMLRDQSFGSRSEQPVEGTSIKDLNPISLETYHNHVMRFNPSFPYVDLPMEQFCEKVGICTSKGELTFGGMLMFGGRDVVQSHLGNFGLIILRYQAPAILMLRLDIPIGFKNKIIFGNLIS